MCPEEDSASVEWARQKGENWVNKDITSLEFVENIFRLMNWNREDVIRILGSPAYICILQRKDRQSIAITPCAAEHPMSFKVPDRLLTDGQCRMRINGVQFI